MGSGDELQKSCGLASGSAEHAAGGRDLFVGWKTSVSTAGTSDGCC